MNLNIVTDIYWERGNYEINQDSACLEHVVLRRHLISMAVVADGIGGLSEGELVSGYVTAKLIKWFYTDGAYLMLRFRARHLLQRSVERLIYTMHCELRKYASDSGKELGTTCTVLLTGRSRYYCVHLGDSRCMHIHENKTKYDAGMKKRKNGGEWITKDDVSETDALTKCIGSMGYYRPEWRNGHYLKNDRFLICSDGFYRRAGDKRISETLSNKSICTQVQLKRSVRTIAAYARKRGERDNMTAICMIM